MDGLTLEPHTHTYTPTPTANAVNEEVSDTRKLLDASTKKYAPPPGAHLYLVCFHLPVTISKVRPLPHRGCVVVLRAIDRIHPPVHTHTTQQCVYTAYPIQTADGQWTAEWNESLIAKTENSVSSVSTTHICTQTDLVRVGSPVFDTIEESYGHTYLCMHVPVHPQ